MPNTTTYFPDLTGATFTRASAKNAWSSTKLTPFASGVPATTDLGISIEAAAVNICENHNANPVDTSEITFTDNGAGGSLLCVDDTAALIAAGLDLVCTGGKVLALFGGSVSATADIDGETPNTANRWGSAYIRGGTGAIQTSSGGATTTFAASASYVRRQTTQISAALVKLRIKADAGQTVYFILNQLGAGNPPSSPIVVSGAAETRQADATALATDLPAAFYIEFTAQALGSNSSVLSWSDGTLNESVNLFENASNDLQVEVIVATVAVMNTSLGPLVRGTTYRVAGRLTAADIAMQMTGNAPVAAAVAVPVTTTQGIGVSALTGRQAALIRNIQAFADPLDDAAIAALVA